MKTYLTTLSLALAMQCASFGFDVPKAMPLWKQGAPGSEARQHEAEIVEKANVSNVHSPSITPFLPSADKNTGLSVVIAPGGGHRILCLGHEGYELAQWFQDRGIAAFVLKYRLARDPHSKDAYTLQDHAMADMRRAIRTIRANAEAWKLDKSKLGVLGFSAGGELAAFAAMKHDEGQSDASDLVERESSRPNFQALIYPGTSRLFTVEKGMPPLFIACGYGDREDIAVGMAELYLKYKRAGVKAELHIYSEAAHGFGYRAKAKPTAASKWPERFTEWLKDSGFLK